MKRQTIDFPWDLYWENKTYKLKKSIKIKYSGLLVDVAK